MSLPSNFFDKLKILSFHPKVYQAQAKELFLELKKENIHPRFISWGNVFGNWKQKLIDLGLAKEEPDTEYPFNLEMKFFGWDYE